MLQQKNPDVHIYSMYIYIYIHIIHIYGGKCSNPSLTLNQKKSGPKNGMMNPRLGRQATHPDSSMCCPTRRSPQVLKKGYRIEIL